MRVAKATLVVPVTAYFKPNDAEHKRRQGLGHVVTLDDGSQAVDNHCMVMVTKASFADDPALWQVNCMLSSGGSYLRVLCFPPISIYLC